jgi:hypothetical protein
MVPSYVNFTDQGVTSSLRDGAITLIGESDVHLLNAEEKLRGLDEPLRAGCCTTCDFRNFRTQMEFCLAIIF